MAEACNRFDQLEADAVNRQFSSKENGNGKEELEATLGFSIDDLPGAGDISCGNFNNANFLTKTLGWPEALQKKLLAMENLKV